MLFGCEELLLSRVILLCMHIIYCKLFRIVELCAAILPLMGMHSGHVVTCRKITNTTYVSYNVTFFMLLSKYIHTLLPLMYTGYLAAPNVVTQSAALDALPAKVPLQSGISFDPNAIEAFIKSLHERE